MDLTPLKTALKTRLGLDILQATATGKQIRILARNSVNRNGDMVIFIDHIHNGWLKRKKLAWTADISKPYFPHPQSAKIVWAWRFLFGADDVAAALPDIVNAILSSPGSSRNEIMEVPLVGASPNRNSMVRGRGVQSATQALVGPAALIAMTQRGGQ